MSKIQFKLNRQAISKYLKERGLTIRQLSKQASMSRGKIALLIKGKTFASEADVRKIAKELHTNPEAISVKEPVKFKPKLKPGRQLEQKKQFVKPLMQHIIKGSQSLGDQIIEGLISFEYKLATKNYDQNPIMFRLEIPFRNRTFNIVYACDPSMLLGEGKEFEDLDPFVQVFIGPKEKLKRIKLSEEKLSQQDKKFLIAVHNLVASELMDRGDFYPLDTYKIL